MNDVELSTPRNTKLLLLASLPPLPRRVVPADAHQPIRRDTTVPPPPPRSLKSKNLQKQR